jgi:hypothetical protein
MLNEGGRIVGRVHRGARRAWPTSSTCSARSGGGPPFALVPAAPARRRLGPIRGPWSGLDGSLTHRAAGARRPVGGGTRPRPVDRGVPFHDVPPGRPGMVPAHVARINYSGDLGYELWVDPQYQRALFDRIVEAGNRTGCALRMRGADVAPAWRRATGPGSASTGPSTRRSRAASPTTSSSTTSSSGAPRMRGAG